ncbi:MAG: Rieske (2Fe-2S) protein [Gemmatimonadetes bacterium]|nr:Rieske (2Fe-2S) protein [Gemmatimonadota bacterium]
MNRRDFVKSLPVVPAGLLLGASALTLSACGGMPYLAPRGSGNRLVVSAARVPEAGVLLQRPGMEHPVFVHATEQGGYTALLVRCTHRGCQPDPVGDRFVCPCHGSEFDLEGAVLRGPAERSLLRYRVAREGEDVVVTLQGEGR